jgi:hypothetical protein
MWLCFLHKFAIIGEVDKLGILFPMLIFYSSSLLDNLPVMLSKAAPSDELATLLKQNFLQIKRTSLENLYESTTEDFFRAIFIYLFVSSHFIISNDQTCLTSLSGV